MATLPFLKPTTVDQAIASLLKTITNLEMVLQNMLQAVRDGETRLTEVQAEITHNSKEAARAENILSKRNDLIGE